MANYSYRFLPNLNESSADALPEVRDRELKRKPRRTPSPPPAIPPKAPAARGSRNAEIAEIMHTEIKAIGSALGRTRVLVSLELRKISMARIARMLPGIQRGPVLTSWTIASAPRAPSQPLEAVSSAIVTTLSILISPCGCNQQFGIVCIQSGLVPWDTPNGTGSAVCERADPCRRADCKSTEQPRNSRTECNGT
jgi:hypothetical protein